MKKVAKNWRYRYLRVFGKICGIKTLMLPKLMHIETIFPNITRKKIQEILKICCKFMKLNKRSVVDTAQSLFETKENNGLGLTRISKFWTPLKISWLRSYTSSKPFWTVLKQEWLLNLGCTYFEPRNTD